MFDWIASGFDKILAKINEFVTWIGTLATGVFTAAWDFIRDGVCWLFESVWDVAISVLSSVNVSGITAQLGAWGNLPPEVTSVLAASGVGPALSVIAAALLIRMLLQLIPFVRLGS